MPSTAERVPQQEPGARTERPLEVSLDAQPERLADIVEQVGDAEGANLLIRKAQVEGAKAAVAAEVQPSAFRAENALGTTEAAVLQEQIAALDAQMEEAEADFSRIMDLSVQKGELEARLTRMVAEHGAKIAAIEAHDPMLERLLTESEGEAERIVAEIPDQIGGERAEAEFDAIVHDVDVERKTATEIRADVAVKKADAALRAAIEAGTQETPDAKTISAFERSAVGPITADERARADARQRAAQASETPDDPFADVGGDMGDLMEAAMAGKAVKSDDDPFKW